MKLIIEIDAGSDVDLARLERLAAALCGPSARAYVAPAPPPEPDLVPDEALAEGRDALRALVSTLREVDGDVADVVRAVLLREGDAIDAYVSACGSLLAAVRGVWSERGGSMTVEQDEEERRAAVEVAGSILGIMGALGFEVPNSWISGGSE